MANPPRRTVNPKRRIHPAPERAMLEALAGKVSYGGNPQHKRNPGDFGLTPPADPRDEKTLCDGSGVLSRREATRLLRIGIRRGLVSLQSRNAWPQNVWSVTDGGVALEAMLDNEAAGSYHGYPMLHGDPLRDEVLRLWGRQ